MGKRVRFLGEIVFFLVFHFFFLGFSAVGEEFLGVDLSNHPKRVGELRIAYGDGPNPISSLIYLLEFVKVRKQVGSVWVSLSPKSKPFTLLSSVLMDTVAGKKMLEYDLKMKRDAMKWVSEHVGEGKEYMFRCWMEPEMVWVDKDKEDTAWVVGKVKMKVKVEVLGEKELPDWAIALKRYLEGRINSSEEYEGLRDLVRAWVLSERVACSGLEMELWPVAWSKLDILDEYRKLFASDAFVGGIGLGEVKEENTGGDPGIKMTKGRDPFDYFRAGFYRVKIYNTGFIPSGKENVTITIFRKGEEEKESVGVIATIKKDFKVFPEDLLKDICLNFFSEDSAEDLVRSLKEIFSEIDRIKILRFPSYKEGIFHDIYGITTFSSSTFRRGREEKGKKNKVCYIFLSDDCFDGDGTLNETGKFVLLHEFVHAGLSQLIDSSVQVVYGRKDVALKIILKLREGGKNVEKILVTGKDILKKVGEEKSKKILDLFYRGPIFLAGRGSGLSLLSRKDKEKDVNLFVIAILLRNGESLQNIMKWINFGFDLLDTKFKEVEKRDKKISDLNAFLVARHVPFELRLNIIRDIVAKNLSSEEIEGLISVLEHIYEIFAPENIVKDFDNLEEREKDVRYMWFWKEIHLLINHYTGRIHRDRNFYLDIFNKMKELFDSSELKPQRLEKSIPNFYSSLTSLLFSLRQTMFLPIAYYCLISKGEEEKAVSWAEIVNSARKMSFYLVNQCVVAPEDKFDEYDPEKNILKLHLDRDYSIEMSTDLVETLTSEELLRFIDERVRIQPLKDALKDFIKKQLPKLEVRSFGFIPFSTPLHVDPKNNCLFIPKGVLFSETAKEIELKENLVLLGILDLALQNESDMAEKISEMMDEEDLGYYDYLLWTYAEDLYQNAEESKGIAWFLWLYNLKNKLGVGEYNSYMERLFFELMFYPGRLRTMETSSQRIRLINNMQSKLDSAGKLSDFWKDVLDLLSSNYFANLTDTRERIKNASKILLDIISASKETNAKIGRENIYMRLKSKPWFTEVFLPELKRYSFIISHQDFPDIFRLVQDKVVSALFLALVDGLVLDGWRGDDDYKNHLREMALRIIKNPSRVSWDLVCALRGEIINKMKETNNKEKEMGGIVL